MAKNILDELFYNGTDEKAKKQSELYNRFFNRLITDYGNYDDFAYILSLDGDSIRKLVELGKEAGLLPEAEKAEKAS